MKLAPLIVPLEKAVGDLSPTECCALVGELERIQMMAWRRILDQNGNGQPPSELVEDRLLTVEEAGKKLGMSEDYLYRHADQLPFTVRPAPRQLRFSLRGIEQYIKQRQSH